MRAGRHLNWIVRGCRCGASIALRPSPGMNDTHLDSMVASVRAGAGSARDVNCEEVSRVWTTVTSVKCLTGDP